MQNRHGRGAFDAPSPFRYLSRYPVFGLYRRSRGGHNNPKLRGACRCGRLLDNRGFGAMRMLSVAAPCGHLATIA